MGKAEAQAVSDGGSSWGPALCAHLHVPGRETLGRESSWGPGHRASQLLGSHSPGLGPEDPERNHHRFLAVFFGGGGYS